MQQSFEDNSMTRIEQLLGHKGRHNDVLYVPKFEDCPTTTNDNIVVFFGGDIQDFRENMRNNSENKKYLPWSLENVAALLRQKFRCSHIVVIRPSRYDRKIFSCYDNFVPSGKYGIPSFIAYNEALRHLKQLMSNLAVRINHDHQTLNKEQHLKQKKQQPLVDFDAVRITLIGFSKGCVVLNQFIHEFGFLQIDVNEKASSEMNQFVSHITNMYFLDGGHAGDKDTWVTDCHLLRIFSTLGINVHIHVTPYQVKDRKRPWIGEEEKIFYETLACDQKVNIFRTLHFENDKPSLNKHFELINLFA